MPFHVSNSTPEREAAARAYLEGTTRLSLALRVELADGRIFAFTDAEDAVSLPAGTWGAITIPATTYRAGEGAFPKDLQQSRDPRKVDNWEFVAFCGEAGSYVLAADVAKGTWRGARFSLLFFARDRLDFQWIRQRGKLGEKSQDKGRATWKMNGLSRLLQQEVLEVTSPISRAKWGDPELAFFNLDGNTFDGFAARVTGTVSGVDATYPRRRFVLAAAVGSAPHRFSDGTITFLSGANSGLVASVLDYDSATGRFTLDQQTPFPIANGDSVRAQIRAPLTLEDWKLFFGTGMYFAAEPKIPNTESASVITRA
ncbi:MAG: DUF2163 domain-containing protein [Armatimonadetes bacterium]|nr:DUF2163 domain-containing protein [Armatimonadota bacterium]